MMNVISTTLEGLKESLKLENFLPFFLFYFLCSICFTVSLLPVIDYIPSIIKMKTTVMPLILTLLLALPFLVAYLVDIWFTAALVYKIKKGTKFSISLKKVKPLYPSLLALVICLKV